ncbi:hypothetical protein SISSUDRAFT_787588 [Sistotremastrum suecicum HHB10207 ss-3]|uniref:DUF6535 domain-containing protein n=1 Tax=Sistotremastrum suecicum HHB10207 ss-3 TaxID=1314776 RepID=A0A166D0Y5_9AGAM|nr:hypothetical protein SISSUDRAFT_787588 [Sistotremastrum suecicum HHB10207 ss-3]
MSLDTPLASSSIKELASFPEEQTSTLPPQTDPFDTPIFRELVTLIRDQNVSSKEQAATLKCQQTTMSLMQKTLETHAEHLKTLTKDVLKDNQPYEQKDTDDESTCTALFEIAMSKTKEEVEEWIKRMDVSLVFIALFSAVLTAFLVPAIQNLVPPSGSDGTGANSSLPAPAPAVSDQNICILWYLALILAISNAVLSVLGRQWMSKLTTRPQGPTYKERLLLHLSREKLAKKWLAYLVETLHFLLLSSISLFMFGLLYQLRILGLGNGEGFGSGPMKRVTATWGLGVVLEGGVAAVMVAATVHGVIYDVSPFSGPFSRSILSFIKFLSSTFQSSMEYVSEIADWLDNRIDSIPFYRLLPPITRCILFIPYLASLLQNSLVTLKTSNPKEFIEAYLSLLSQSNDPNLLERAIGSFSLVGWVKYCSGNGKWDDIELSVKMLKKAYTRLTASDTSFRVHQTLKARLRSFIRGCRESGIRPHQLQLEYLTYRCSFPDEFAVQVGLCSLGENNSDLAPLAEEGMNGGREEGFEKCIGGVLGSYQSAGEGGEGGGKAGYRRHIYDLAQGYVEKLITALSSSSNSSTSPNSPSASATAVVKADAKAKLHKIFADVDPGDLIKSFVLSPFETYPSLVEFVAKGKKKRLMRILIEFVEDCEKRGEAGRVSTACLCQVFIILASPDTDTDAHINYNADASPNWIVNIDADADADEHNHNDDDEGSEIDLDLTPFLNHITKYPDYFRWSQTTDILLSPPSPPSPPSPSSPSSPFSSPSSSPTSSPYALRINRVSELGVLRRFLELCTEMVGYNRWGGVERYVREGSCLRARELLEGAFGSFFVSFLFIVD